MVMAMMVVVFMPVKCECASSSCAEQRPVFWRRCYHRRCSFTADMTVEADDAVRCAHHDVQFVTDHENSAARVLSHSFDLLVKGCRPALVKPLCGFVQEKQFRLSDQGTS